MNFCSFTNPKQENIFIDLEVQTTKIAFKNTIFIRNVSKFSAYRRGIVLILIFMTIILTEKEIPIMETINFHFKFSRNHTYQTQIESKFRLFDSRLGTHGDPVIENSLHPLDHVRVMLKGAPHIRTLHHRVLMDKMHTQIVYTRSRTHPFRMT